MIETHFIRMRKDYKDMHLQNVYKCDSIMRANGEPGLATAGGAAWAVLATGSFYL